MSNEWGKLHVASYDNVRVELLDVDDETPRDVVVTVYPRTNGGHVADQGAALRRTRWRIAFFPDFSGFSHIERFQFFWKLLHDGKAHTLVHPLTGSMLARPSDISFSASGGDRDYIALNVTFLEATEKAAVFTIGTGSPIAAGVQDVHDTNAQLDTELEDLGLTSTVGDTAAALASTWEENRDTITGREINLQLNDINNQINDAYEDLEVATNLDRYPLMVTLTKLSGNTQRLADAVLSQSPEQVTIVAQTDEPLLAIAARVYGADEAVDRMEQLLELNRVRKPELVAAGTELIGNAVGSPLTRREPI